jgi:hypothetical protein
MARPAPGPWAIAKLQPATVIRGDVDATRRDETCHLEPHEAASNNEASIAQAPMT